MPVRFSTALQATISAWLQGQRWFGGKGRSFASIDLLQTIPLSVDQQVQLQVLRLEYSDGTTECYLTAWPSAWQPWQQSESEQIAVPSEWFNDPASLAALWQELLAGELTTWHAPEFWARTLQPTTATIQLASFEQSNTCLIVDGQYLLKFYRKMHLGLNPDAELSQFLTTSAQTIVSPRLQAILSCQFLNEQWTLACLHQYLPGAKTAWEVLLEQLTHDLEAWLAAPSPEAMQLPNCAELVTKLGQLTMRMLNELGQGTAAKLRLEPWTMADSQDAATHQLDYSTKQLQLLAERMSSLPPATQLLAQQVLAKQSELLNRFAAWQQITSGGAKIRIHGDYHLGQVLVTKEKSEYTLWVIDFEGEPARSLIERRAKKSPWQDIAGMIRSLNYAVIVAWRGMRENEQQALDITQRNQLLQQFTAQLEQSFLAACLQLPADQVVSKRDPMLQLFILEKACYELGYELLNRPDWVEVPLLGIAQFVGN